MRVSVESLRSMGLPMPAVNGPPHTFLHSLSHMGLGDRVRERRKAIGLTQVQLAERVSVDQSTVSDIETGETADPSSHLLASIARALDTSSEALLWGTDAPPATDELVRQVRRAAPDQKSLAELLARILGPAVPDERVAKHLPPLPRKPKKHR